MKASMGSPSCWTEVKEAPCRDLPCRIENQISTWLRKASPRRRDVEMHVRMTFEPSIILGLVRVERSALDAPAARRVVEDDRDGRGRVSHDDRVHEGEELDAPPALLVDGRLGMAVTLPAATSKAANRADVPLRL